MTNPKVSIVIPCYNGEAFVGDAIASALAQSWSEIEIVVIDDGSTDASRDVIESFGAEIRLIRTANRGGGAARNAGLDVASGEFVQFLDSDDLLLPECVERKLKLMEQHGDCPVGDWRTIDEKGMSATLGHADLDAEGDPVIAQLGTQMPTLSPLHRREGLVAVGGFDASLPCSQERDLHLRLACKGIVFRRAPEVLHEVRRRHGSVSSDYSRVLLQHEKIFERCIDQLQGNGGWNDERAVAFARAYARDAQHLLRGWPAHADIARRYFRRACGLSPAGMRAIYSHPLKRTLAAMFGPFAVERCLQVMTPNSIT